MTNLASRIHKYLPGTIIAVIRRAGELAAEKGYSVYLVGGAVRDLLLGRANLDIDLAVEGDAIELAQRLAEGGKLTRYGQFGTATIKWHSWSLDLATARSETYPRPGALPEVKPGNISIDLSRRDFTINAMAVSLDPADFGEIIDPYSGRDDIREKLIRVLHDKSFIDDPTRIWRAIRYEQRLDFAIEPTTLSLLKRDQAMLDTITADRAWYELECVLKEACPEKALRRAGELGVLANIHVALAADDWLAAKFQAARRLDPAKSPPVALYLAVLAYRLSAVEIEELIPRLNLSRALSQDLRDVSGLKPKLDSLPDDPLANSAVYHILHGYSLTAITAAAIAVDNEPVRDRLFLYRDRLRYVKPSLTGDDLQRLGARTGPEVGRLLHHLLDARLDGLVSNREQEEKFVRKEMINDRRD